MTTEDNNTHNEGFRRLEAIIYVFGINKEIWRHVDKFFVLQGPHQDQNLSLSSITNRLDLNDRVWEVLEKRHGFSRRYSLDEVAIDLGVTRERVRQIEYRALAKVEKRINGVINPLSQLDNQISSEWTSFEKATTINEAIFPYRRLLADMGWEDTRGREIRQLFIILRALVRLNIGGIERHLPSLSYAACCLLPGVLKHPKVGEQERERQHQQLDQERKWTYERLVEVVLTDANIPLHYTEIARRAESLEHRDNLSVKGIHNVLLSNSDKFAYVDQGTYGLTAWGLTSVDTYTDIIAEALKTAGKPLPYGNVLQLVKAKRAIKPQTLQMTLDMNARFYCSQEETYGLRAWLLPREKQTLRTPKWQVEISQSYERVQRAIEHGYDVEAIVAQDRE